MRYLFKYTYTPEDPNSERSRKGVVVDADDAEDAIRRGLSKLEMATLTNDVIVEYRVANEGEGHDDCGWVGGTNNGEYFYEIEPFEAKDPVTKGAILTFFTERADTTRLALQTKAEQIQEQLCCLMCRWTWRSLEWQDASDLRETLYSLMIEGDVSKPYSKMNVDELLNAIMEEVVEAQRDNFDEIDKGTPFGMAAMVAEDHELWCEG